MKVTPVKCKNCSVYPDCHVLIYSILLINYPLFTGVPTTRVSEDEDEDGLKPAFDYDSGLNDAASTETALKLFQIQNVQDGPKERISVCRVDGVTELRREIMSVYKNPKVNLKLAPRIRFEEEEGVGSGPVREFFVECIRVVDEGIPSSSGKPAIFLEGESDHRVPVHDHSLRLTGAFKVVGKIIGHSILHDGPGVTGLSPAVKHFLSNEMNSETQPPQLSLQDIPDMELRQLISEVS